MYYKELELDKLGFKSIDKIYRNLSIERIVEEGLLNGETKMAMNGATMVDTGEYTGRSPQDKYFVVEPTSKDKLWWGPVNAKVDLSIFDELYDKIIDSYLNALDDVFKTISGCENGDISIDNLLKGSVCHSGFERLN